MSYLRLRLRLRFLLSHRRRRRCRRTRSTAMKTPLQDDDLLSEILLRLPPQPSSLPRASLVCKRWRSLASDPAFFRRFRRHHHRNLPLLGFFNGFYDLTFTPTLDTPNRVPPGRFSLQSGEGDRDHLRSLGCRHGLMLLLNQTYQMLVWDPVTGDQNRLAIPPEITTQWINGAVLRPAEEADHFQVVLVAADNKDRHHRRALACVYSSQTGLWGDLISTPLPSGILGRSHYPTILRYGRTAVLSGDSLYWMLGGNCDGILEFDLEKQSLGVIQVPAHMCMGEEENHTFWIMGAEGGGLGLLFPTCSNIGSTIQLWKRKADCDGVASWALGRTIELDNLLPLKPLSPTIVGFAENNDVVFLWTSGAVFMIHLESLQCKKLESEHRHHVHVHPFESVYKGGIGDEHDAADLLQYA